MALRARPLCLLLLSAIVTGCGRVEQVERAAPPPDALTSDIVDVPVGAQASMGDLRIALGYVRKSVPVDVSGTRRNLEAGLWIYVREDPSKNAVVSVWAGQRVSAGAAVIFVEEVRGGRNAAVHLVISGLSKASPPIDRDRLEQK